MKLIEWLSQYQYKSSMRILLHCSRGKGGHRSFKLAHHEASIFGKGAVDVASPLGAWATPLTGKLLSDPMEVWLTGMFKTLAESTVLLSQHHSQKATHGYYTAQLCHLNRESCKAEAETRSGYIISESKDWLNRIHLAENSSHVCVQLCA